MAKEEGPLFLREQVKAKSLPCNRFIWAYLVKLYPREKRKFNEGPIISCIFKITSDQIGYVMKWLLLRKHKRIKN